MKGVSGLAGLLGDLLIYGGGCNFPEGGPLEGGAKRYYRTLYALRVSEDGEVGEAFVAGTLDRPTGYGASLASRDGKALCFVGGTDGTEALSTIYRITLTEEGKPQVEPLRGAMSTAGMRVARFSTRESLPLVRLVGPGRADDQPRVYRP